jgi:glycosyltransferase involved in cell wall biosynthesis
MSKRVLIIPMYNEARTILNVLERAYPHVDLIIVVDDGSTDPCGQMVRLWGLEHPGVHLLALRTNLGMSGALLVGFSFVLFLHQSGLLTADDIVINIDADGQHMPEEIPPALAVMQLSGSDVLLGRRHLHGYPWFKWIGNWGLSLWASLLSGYRYHDVECGFRLMRVAVVADMLPYFLGRRYGCAQEIGIITARRKWRVHNRFPTEITYYRTGARVRDGVTNLWMGLLACCRVVADRQIPTEQRLQDVFALLTEPPAADLSLTPWAASF